MTDQNGPIVSEQLWENMSFDSVVDGVEISDVEGGKRVLSEEMFGKEIRPRVVAHKDGGFSRGVELSEEVVFDDLISVEIGADVDESGQAARRQALKALHGRRRRVGDKLEESGFGRIRRFEAPKYRHLVEEGFLIVFFERSMVVGKVVAESVYHDDDEFGKLGWWKMSACRGGRRRVPFAVSAVANLDATE